MAKISNNNLHNFGTTKNGVDTCFFCNNKINRGANWIGITDFATCQNCCIKLLDILIDVLEDNSVFDNLTISEKANYIYKKSFRDS